MVTITDIGREAGVSRTLVFRVPNQKSGVSPENRKKILEVIEKYLKYVEYFSRGRTDVMMCAGRHAFLKYNCESIHIFMKWIKDITDKTISWL